jgi:CheY-like chemotaxis protein
MAQPPTAGGTILVVDDEPAIRESIAELLEAEGYRVQPLARADEALAALRRERAALVLVDLVMPAMTGADLVRAVRADPALNSVRLVLMTAAMPAPGEANVAADGVLRKPFDLDDLLATVARHCRPEG